MNRILTRALTLTCLLLAPGHGAAGLAAAPATCGAPAFAPPGRWIAGLRDGIFSYRSETDPAELVIARYRISAGDPDPEMVMRRSASQRRQLEHRFADGPLQLSALATRYAGDVLLMHYSGDDPAGARRFSNLMLGTAGWLLNMRLETQGLSERDFRALRRRAFAAVADASAAAVAGALACTADTAPSLARAVPPLPLPQLRLPPLPGLTPLP